MFFGLILVPNIIVSAGPRRGNLPTVHSRCCLSSACRCSRSLTAACRPSQNAVRPRPCPANAKLLPAHVIVTAGILLSLFVLYPAAGKLNSRASSRSEFWPCRPAIGVPALWGAHFNRFAPMLDLARGVLQPADDLGAQLVDHQLIAACGDPCGDFFCRHSGGNRLAMATEPSARGNGRLPKRLPTHDGSANRLGGGRAAPHRGDASWPQLVREQRWRLVACSDWWLLRRQPGWPHACAALRLRGQSRRSPGLFFA